MPLIPARFRRPDPETVKREALRKDVAAVVKVVQSMGAPKNATASMPGSQFQGGWNNLGNASMAMLQRVTENLSRQHSVPVAEIEEQLIEQGLTWGPPFPPGRPLDPFFGFRRQPRTWDYTVGENVQLTPRWQRISFETLKAIYEAYDVAQICVRMKINDLRSLDYDWVPLPGERDDVSRDIDQARAFFEFPDKAQPFRNWLAEWLQDVLRYDAGALYINRTNAGQPYSLEVVTGPSLIPLIDFYGRVAADRDEMAIPQGGVWSGGDTPGFLQIVEGMPWDWLTVDDVIYQPWNPLPESQYGLAPLEAILTSANTDLRFQMHFLEYFTAGSLPAGLMEAPADLSDPAMVAELQETWDALMVGDQEMLRRIRFVPNGSKFTPVKNADFDSEFPLYLMRRTAAAYGVTPANLGYTETVNRASSDTQVDIQWRVGTLPLVRHVEDVINLFVRQHLGLKCRLQFDKGQEVEDRLMTMQAHQGYVDMGAISVDEVRAELGKPIDRSRPIPRFISNPRLGPIPLITIESMSGKIDEETYAPDASQELIPNPYIGSPGVVPPMGSPEAKAAAASAAQMQRELLQATTGQEPTPSMQAAIAAANPPPAGASPAGPSKGPEGTTAQPAEVPPGQGAGSSPKPSQAAQTASKEYRPQFDDEAVSWYAPNGEKKIGYVQMVGENGDVALADEPGGEAMYLIPFQQIDPEDGPYVEVSPNVFEAAKSRRAAWLAKDGLGGGGNVSGIYSSGSGIQGSPLASGSGAPDDDDDDETSELYGYNEEWRAAKSLDALIDLRRWRENARNRIRKGQSPRQFRSTSIPPDVQAYIWGRLEKAQDRREVNAIFADVVAGRPFGGPALGSRTLAEKAVGEKADDDDFDGVVAGGLIVQARDTGRVLMIQRLPDKHDDDAAYARWEWPGGCLDVDDQGVWQGALREWEEETGSALDEDAQHVGSFLSEDGNYQAYVIQVPSEDDLDFDIQPEEIADIGWWDPADLTDGRVRDKVSENLEPLQRFLMSPAAKASAASVHRHTDRIVAHYQPLIAQAFEDLFPQNALEQAIGETQTAAPLAGVAKAKGPAVLAATAVGALRSRLSGSLARLRQILQSLYGDAALQATRAASQQLGGVIGGTYRSLMQELPDDYWDRWQPGWGDAASQLADGGMRDLLDRAGIQIKSIVDTRLNDLGDLIAQGVAAGDSIDKVARDAQGLLSDPSRALMIADTEYARGMTAQSLQDYRQAGVEQIQWLAEDDACPDCLENEAASPIPIGDSWPNGDVPVHPMCRCALVALVDTSE